MNYHLVARTYSCKGDFRTALHNEKQAYIIYKQLVSHTRYPTHLPVDKTLWVDAHLVGVYHAILLQTRLGLVRSCEKFECRGTDYSGGFHLADN